MYSVENKVRGVIAAKLQDSFNKNNRKTEIQYLFVTSPVQFHDIIKNNDFAYMRCYVGSVNCVQEAGRGISAATLQDSYNKNKKKTDIQYLFVTSPVQFQDLYEIL